MSKTFLIFSLFFLLVIIGSLYKFLVPRPYANVKSIQIGSAVFHLEIADTTLKRMRGLSGRASLSENQGMLFVFDSPDNYGFWMKGMRIPLDMVWIKESEVIAIDKNIPATSSKVYFSPEPADKVLEINAGLADKFGLKVGGKIELDYNNN